MCLEGTYNLQIDLLCCERPKLEEVTSLDFNARGVKSNRSHHTGFKISELLLKVAVVIMIM